MPPGAGDSCNYSIYGLDCSGFLYTIFAENGINFINGPADMQRRPEVLEKYLKEYVGSEHLEVKDLGKLALSEIKAGDIIYSFEMLKNKEGNAYRRAKHIGIAYVKPGTDKVFFYNSSGSRNWCKKNLEKGPTAYLLGNGLPQRYGVVRVLYNRNKF